MNSNSSSMSGSDKTPKKRFAQLKASDQSPKQDKIEMKASHRLESIKEVNESASISVCLAN
jgi:hypothetical protein